jgi:predicted MFS family arabinose efflux permease
MLVCVGSTEGLAIPLGSTMFTSAMGQIMKTYHSSSFPPLFLVVRLRVLGYFLGSLFLETLSKLYGRLPVYWLYNVFCKASNVAGALSPSLPALVVSQFLAGKFGGCLITIGADTLRDLIHPRSYLRIITI